MRQSDPFLQWFDCAGAHPRSWCGSRAVANPVGADVLLDAGSGGQHRFAVRHDDESTDLAALIEDRLSPSRVRRAATGTGGRPRQQRGNQASSSNSASWVSAAPWLAVTWSR